MPLELHVVTPAQTVVEATVDAVVASAAEGEIGLLPGHENFLAALKPGVLVYRSGAASERVAVAGGFVEIAGDCVTILANDAALPANIDRASAEAACESARSALSQTSLASPPEQIEAARDALAVAEAWLEALSR